MEGYYDNSMFQHNVQSRRRSTLERITDPNTVTNYLCGYSLRICTLYLLWIHLVFTLSLLATAIITTTYVSISFKVVHEPNNTLYTLTVNNQKWISIDAYIEDLDVNMIIIGHKTAQLFFSWVILDMCITIMALFGVYLSKVMLMVPYFVPIFNNILWLVLLLIMEAVLTLLNVMSWCWLLAIVVVIFLLIDFYRFIVLYSYFHMVGKHFFSKPFTPQYLSTHSPLLEMESTTAIVPPVAPTPTVAPADSEVSSPFKSDDADSVENG